MHTGGLPAKSSDEEYTRRVSRSRDCSNDGFESTALHVAEWAEQIQRTAAFSTQDAARSQCGVRQTHVSDVETLAIQVCPLQRVELCPGLLCLKFGTGMLRQQFWHPRIHNQSENGRYPVDSVS